MKKDPKRYDDMLYLSRHQSSVHPPMSLLNRAAQFSPFAALTGYGDAVKETARLTQERISLDESRQAQLDRKLSLLIEHMAAHPFVSVTYFVPDPRKEGGSYVTAAGKVKKISLTERTLFFLPEEGDSLSSRPISLDDIIAISGEIFKEIDGAEL